MNGKESATFSEIIHHMITEAWYMVSEYHLNLGPMDTLEKLVLDLQGESGLTASAEPRKIHEFLVLAENDSDTKKGEMSKRLKKYETTLTNMIFGFILERKEKKASLIRNSQEDTEKSRAEHTEK